MSDLKTVTFDVLEIARETGLRELMHGVSPTDARSVLERFIAQGLIDALAATPTPAVTHFDVEKMLRETIPGGNLCDPQKVCDAIRSWVSENAPTPAAQSAGQEAVRFGAVELILRDICEIDPADPEKNDTACIDISDLKIILERHVGFDVAVSEQEPATDSEEAEALRAFDQSKQQGHSHDLESYCAGYIDRGYAAPVNGGEDELGQVIDERDQYHDAADKLANAVAEYFGVEIGEHSNLNCPWQNALDHITQATKRAADAPQVGGQWSIEARSPDIAHIVDVTGKWISSCYKAEAAAIVAAHNAALSSPAKPTGIAINADAPSLSLDASTAKDAQQKPMTDRQIIELCKSVGVEWEGPDMCDFMGDFGRVNMAGMRAIINAVKEQK